jgi:hypothetical protein
VQIPLALLVIFDAGIQSDPIYATTNLSFVATIISAGENRPPLLIPSHANDPESRK